MKHSTIRASILTIAFIIVAVSSIYFQRYKIGGPRILLPLGELEAGLVLLLAGIMVLFDTFFRLRKGHIKRKRNVIDVPFVLSLFFVFMGVLFLKNGFLDLIPMKIINMKLPF